MDTYGDMVTLLLCFFVLLYSISTIDQQKWMIVVQSFNRNAIVNPEDTPPGPVGSDTGSGGAGLPATDTVEQDLKELFEFLKQTIASSEVSVSRGDGYVFISFDDTIFFDGNKFDLRPEGEAILDEIIPALSKAGRSIDELEVLGHTAQAGNVPNPTLNDRLLSSQRAAVVAAYIQDHVDYARLSPGRIVSIGHGQWRNVGDNATAEGKAKNRRVEIVVTGRNLENSMADHFEQYKTMYESTKVSN